VIRHPRRDALQNMIGEQGIGTLIHYPIPPHLSSAYAGLGIPRGRFPVTELLAETVLSVPMGPHINQTEAQFVGKVIDQCCHAMTSK